MLLLILIPAFSIVSASVVFLILRSEVRHVKEGARLREKELEAKELKFSAIYRDSLDVMVIVDGRNETIIDVNPAVTPVLGYSREEWIGSSLSTFRVKRIEHESEIEDRIYRGGVIETEGIYRADGTVCMMDMTLSVIPWGDDMAILASFRDTTDRKRLEESRLKYQFIVNSTREFMALVDALGRIEAINDAFGEALGKTRNELIGKFLGDVIGIHQFETALRVPLDQAFKNADIVFQHLFQFPQGEKYFEVRLSPYRSRGQSPGYVALVLRDITEQKTAQDRLLFETLHDALTGLPNRALFFDRLEHAMARCQRNPEFIYAVLFLDLDRFKNVNDSLGHLVGDKLLIQASSRLKLCLRPEDTAARLGGDEFCVLVEELTGIQDAMTIASRIQSEFSFPFQIDGYEISVSVSIGIRPGTSASEKPEDILRDADTALYRAKAQGKDRSEVFDIEMRTGTIRRFALESDLRKATSLDELKLFGQPIVSLESGRILGFEMLLRWEHPTRGLISPGEFISIAEETGIIVSMGEWIFRTACGQLASWRREGFDDIYFSVNVSPRQLQQKDFGELLLGIIEESGIESQFLQLELTESMLMDNRHNSLIAHLHEKGFPLALDDFGTGYSSFSYLRQFPVQILKIDISFIRGLLQNTNDAAITSAIIAMARQLNMKVTAEGVESHGQKDMLRRIHCDAAQGYLFSPPVPMDRALEMLRSGAGAF